MKAFVDNKLNVMTKGRKHCEKRKKCWLSAFSGYQHFPFSLLSSKPVSVRVVKTCIYVVKG